MGTQARVIRIIEYTGDAVNVFAQVDRSLHGTKNWGSGVVITAETLRTEIYDVEVVPNKKPTATDLLLAQIRFEKLLEEE